MLSDATQRGGLAHARGSHDHAPVGVELTARDREEPDLHVVPHPLEDAGAAPRICSSSPKETSAATELSSLKLRGSSTRGRRTAGLRPETDERQEVVAALVVKDRVLGEQEGDRIELLDRLE